MTPVLRTQDTCSVRKHPWRMAFARLSPPPEGHRESPPIEGTDMRIAQNPIQFLDASVAARTISEVAVRNRQKSSQETLLHAAVTVFCLSRIAGLLLRQ